MGANLSCLSISNVPASTKQGTFLLYSVALMMKKMMNLINFILRLHQSEQKIYKIIALLTQLCELWNECVFIATTRLCLIRFIYTPTRHHYDVTFFSDVIRRHVTFQPFFSDVIRRHHSFVCVENNTIFTQMLENKRQTLCVALVTSDVTYSRHSTHSIGSQNCPRIGLSPLLMQLVLKIGG